MPTKEAYSHSAWLYDLLDLPFEHGRHRLVRRMAFEGVSGKVLDAGVGTGRNMPFYPPDAEVTGIDLSPQMLTLAEARKTRLGIAAELYQRDVKATGFPDQHFDNVIATFLFCVIEDDDQLPALSELRRVCKPNGEIRILDYVYSRDPLRRFVMSLWAPWIRMMYGAAFDRPTARYVEAAGLKVIEERFLFRDMIKLLILQPR